MKILFRFQCFARKWQKIPVDVCLHLMQNGNPAHFYPCNQKFFHPDMAVASSHNRQC